MTTAMVSTEVNGRWTLKLPAYRAERPEWATGWERERLDAMHELIVPGDLVYDVGAEEGDLSALYALWGADVMLLEPNPLAWPNIRAIFEANGLMDRMAGWWVGFVGTDEVWASEWTRANVAGDDRWGTWPSCAFGEMVKAHGFLMRSDCPELPCLPLDKIVAPGHHAPTVVTIDVEGGEVDVLASAAGLLTKRRPAVFVSVHVNLPGLDETHPDDLREQVAAIMEGHGYVGTLLAVDHEEHWAWRHPEGR